MATNRQLFEANQRVFAALGFALSNFAQIEFGLLALFDVASGLSQEESSEKFWSCRRTADQIKEVNRLVRPLLPDKERPRWDDLTRQLRQCIDDRNGLAHGEIVVLSRAPGLTESFFAPRFQKNLSKGTGTGPLDWQPGEKLLEAELIELAEKFWIVARQTDRFWDLLDAGRQ